MSFGVIPARLLLWRKEDGIQAFYYFGLSVRIRLKWKGN